MSLNEMQIAFVIACGSIGGLLGCCVCAMVFCLSKYLRK